MKKYLPAILVVVLAIAGAVFAVVVSQKDSKTSADSTATSACLNKGVLHKLTIKDDAFDTTDLVVQRCDQIEVINQDNTARRIALGEHDHHIAYPGFKEASLGRGDSYTFTAFKAGHYHVHDHIHDEVESSIDIK